MINKWVEHICDRCGCKSINPNISQSCHGNIDIVIPYENEDQSHVYPITYHYDLCGKCALELQKYLKQKIESRK